MNKKRLGRGLSALLGTEEGGFEPSSLEAAELIHVAVDQVDPNPFQPRREFDPGELSALADSLRQHGMLQPVRNFHLPLPEPLNRRLRDVAARTNRPTTAVARYAIESWLRHQRRAAVREAIAAYAAGVAGSQEDLDPALETAALDALRPRPSTTRRRSR